jgi:GDP-4-dehydro-6-deoxy-D-mannose reductase
VTGAGGFVGAELCRHLVAEGLPFVGVLRPGSLEPAPAEIAWPAKSFIESDLTQPASARQLIDRVRPTVIFNLAAVGVRRGVLADAAQFIRTNLCLAASLFEAMLPQCVLVHVGSMSQYKSAPGVLHEETAEREQSTLYAWTKNAAEEFLELMAAAHAKRYVRVRLFGIVGRGEAPDRLLPSIARASRTSEPIPLTDGTQVRDVVHVSDAARGLLHISRSPSLFGLAVNLGRGEGWTVRQIAETAASELGCADRLQFGSLPRHVGEGDRYVADVARLSAAGWRPTFEFGESIRLATSQLAREYRSD